MQNPPPVKYYAEEAVLYSYMSEGVDDLGWGCAWRTIQTSLSTYSEEAPLKNLFEIFGSKEKLAELYKDKHKEDIPKSAEPFAPHDRPEGWAEPFIGQMVMHAYRIPSELDKINGIPSGCKAPMGVFKNELLKFAGFREKLVAHFTKPKPAPVMIDDGTWALSIVGAEAKDDGETVLWISDPHIKAQSPAGTGLYTITLDKDGNKTKCSLDDVDKSQVNYMYSESSYKGLTFNAKKWMVLFPQPKT